MIRLVHYLSHIRLELGGVQRAVLDLCRATAAHGHRTTLICYDGTDVPPEWRGDAPGLPRVAVIDRPTGRAGRLTPAARATVADLLGQSDVLHLHAMWDPTNVAMADLAARAGVPYVLTPHGMLDDWSMAQKRLKKRLYLTLRGNRLLRNAARIHCTAQGELDQAHKWFPNGKGVVLPLVFDLAAFETLPGPELAIETFPALQSGDGASATLLFLSRVHPKKGVEALIDAVAQLKQCGRTVRALIAGPGDENYVTALRARTRDRGVHAHVQFLGMVRGPAKLSLYQAADLFVLPTSQENFGLVLLEALACQTPVVTTRGVDIWKELQSAGATITDQSGPSIAATIDQLLTDPTLKSRGDRGRQWVLDNFNPTRLTNDYAAMYQSCRT